MKVTKIYDFSKEIENTSNDKVILEMSSDEYTKLRSVLFLSEISTSMNRLSDEIKRLLKQFDENTETKHID